jgi:signal transduction histidine kinase
MTQATIGTLQISLFELLRAEFGQTLPMLRCSKATLVHLSHTLEDLVLTQRLPALLFTGFQASSHWRKETERYRALAEVAQQVCIFAGGTLPPESHASQLHVTLRGDDPLRQEWFLVLLSPQFAALLCGQDRQTRADTEAGRQFDTLFSFDPAAIERVLDLLEQVVADYRPERLAGLQQARRDYPLATPDAQIIAKFTLEMVRFEEHIHQALRTTTTALDQQLRWHDDLTATLVHDMRSQLQGISLAIQMLQSGMGEDEETHAHLLQVAARNTSQLQDLMQLILDASQLTAGQLKVTWQLLEPHALLRDASAPLGLALEQGRLELRTEVDPSVVNLWGDEQLLRRVLQNLISNAAKFTPPGGQITVRVNPAPSGDAIEVHVRDTGAGIAPSAIGKIFDRYYQADMQARKGNGLGLYFCRMAVEAHGGSIRAASQVGVGTTITFTLSSRPPLSALM